MPTCGGAAPAVLTHTEPRTFPPRVLAILLSAAFGYFLGSVPFGLLAGLMRGVDVRTHGSKNIGATNVWRVCGWRFGLPVFVLDAAKGATPVIVAGMFAEHFGGDAEWARVAGAMACIVGHSFPVWLGFKGGKGVATSLGAILAMMWLPSVIAFGVWAVIFAVWRYVSLASVVTSVAFPVIAYFFDWRGPALGFSVAAAALVVARHRTNFQRLLAGTEHRSGRGTK